MEVSSPDKVMFPQPGFTKADLVGHYARIADRMLPWIVGRPLTLERYPNGVDSKGFFQKNASSHFSERIERIEVPKSDGTVLHPVVRDTDGLLELANQGTIAFHVWTAALPDLDQPTHLVLDLDPEAGDLASVRETAVGCRSLLGEFGLTALLVASGKKGFHLWVPIDAHSYEQVGQAAHALAGLVAGRLPEVATVEFLRKHRRKRVFVDWLRNRRAQSIVCPWSLRVSPAGTVATPIEWRELALVAPDDWTLATVADRPALSMPDPAALEVDAILSAARESGVDLESDRFGRDGDNRSL